MMAYTPLQLLKLLRSNLLLLAVTTVLAVSVGVGYCLLAERIYQSTAVLLVRLTSFGREVPSSVAVSRQQQTINSYARLLTSHDVLRSALKKVSIHQLYPEIKSGTLLDLDEAALYLQRVLKRSRFVGDEEGQAGSSAPAATATPENATGAVLEQGLALVKKNLRVQAEANTDLIRISFQHPNPKLAADFVEALIASLIELDSGFLGASRSASFFEKQKSEQDKAFAAASLALSEFAAKHSMYAVDEQRKLTLARLSALMSDLSSTRSSIAEKEAQRLATTQQLAQMKPFAQHPAITGLAKDGKEAGTKSEAAGSRAQHDASSRAILSNPPVLLIKVYQETVQNLVKLQIDLDGLRSLEATKQAELEIVQRELTKLTENEAAFERLKLDVSRAKQSAELYGKLADEGLLEQQLAASKLSNIQVAQRAEAPVRHVSPDTKIILPLFAVLGFLFGVMIAVVLHFSRTTVTPPRVREPVQLRPDIALAFSQKRKLEAGE